MRSVFSPVTTFEYGMQQCWVTTSRMAANMDIVDTNAFSLRKQAEFWSWTLLRKEKNQLESLKHGHHLRITNNRQLLRRRLLHNMDRVIENTSWYQANATICSFRLVSPWAVVTSSDCSADRVRFWGATWRGKTSRPCARFGKESWTSIQMIYDSGGKSHTYLLTPEAPGRIEQAHIDPFELEPTQRLQSLQTWY